MTRHLQLPVGRSVGFGLAAMSGIPPPAACQPVLQVGSVSV